MDGTNVETVISNSTHAITTPMDLAIDNSGINRIISLENEINKLPKTNENEPFQYFAVLCDTNRVF